MLRSFLKDETVWLTQKAIGELFGKERSVITKHLKNIFASGELEEKSNVQKMHFSHSDKPIKFYNLDVIISVGYRVNSYQATQFRIWATRTLKEFIIKGFVLDDERLKQGCQYIYAPTIAPDSDTPERQSFDRCAAHGATANCCRQD